MTEIKTGMPEKMPPVTADGVGERPEPIPGFDDPTYIRVVNDSSFLAQQASIDAWRAKKEARAVRTAAMIENVRQLARKAFGKH